MGDFSHSTGNSAPGAYGGEEAAAHAYNLAELKYWGHDTILDFLLSSYDQELKEMEEQSREEYIGSLRRTPVIKPHYEIISDAVYISDDEGKRCHKRQCAKKTRGRAPCSEPCLCERTVTRGPIWCKLWGKPSLTINKRFM
ncbi:uncharacterized protein LOC119321110 [Triticum dicoccoides]|uniref:uncharacterized protein LOC119321110 n=1 Tax=Triticum dicoccoides TaxID=85692 RepID=UPI001890BEA2|nr:uncharacterized protein LOC119321110 [Triticum dicoccoides]XP_037450838.1 uncharacterized protein LOC119321110 [Triticum dicoccoides]XP_037450839.1 uncharacterized protein LOC119321110 [Triticum dicoccoides]XP_037450840.1 uncharacterized protein LOC119321110 [Triticum dicoccoides]